MDHIQNHCLYEFDNNQNILRICLEQKKNFTEQQSYQFKELGQFQQNNIEQNSIQTTNSQAQEKVPTLLMANFPQVGMVELCKKFGPISKFHFDNKNNLIFYVTYEHNYSQQMALQQLSGIQIQGKKLRVTQFIEKEALKKCRLFVNGLKTNNESLIRETMEQCLGIPVTQASLLNQKTENHDASAFLQFEQKDLEKVQSMINKIFKTQIGEKVQVKAYRPRNENPSYKQNAI